MPIGQDDNFCLFDLLHQLQLAIVSWAVQLLHTSLLFCNFSKLSKHMHPSLKIIEQQVLGLEKKREKKDQQKDFQTLKMEPECMWLSSKLAW